MEESGKERVVWSNVVVVEVRRRLDPRSILKIEPSEFTTELDVRLWGNHGCPDKSDWSHWRDGILMKFS